MKAFLEKYLPFFFILPGIGRLFGELFPNRLGFLLIPGGKTTGWVFWTLGLAGVIWLLLRSFAGRPAVSAGHEDFSGSGLKGIFQKYWIEMMILFVTAFSLSMLVRSGYFWDDAVNSTVYLAEKKDAVPTLQHVLTFMHKYLELGRLNVLSFYYYFFFYIENVSVYKIIIIFSILADQLIFRQVLREFGVPLPWARVGMLLIPLLLQMRTYQDPVSGFYSLMQVLTAEMLLCALFLSRWLRSGKAANLAGSLLMYVTGLLTYEVCFPFLLMICLLILVRRRNFWRAVRDSLPFAGVTVLMLAGVFFVRSRFAAESAYAGVAFSLDPVSVLRTAFRQFYSGLPLSFYTAGFQGSVLGNVYPAESFMNYDFVSFLKSVRLSDAAAVLICLFLLWKSGIREPEQEKTGRLPELFVLGACFAVLPVITVAMSERYQGQLVPGLGYLPVYMQYYGIAALSVWLTMKLRPSACARSLCLSAFVMILLLNLQNNRAVTEIMNRSFYDPRSAGEAALKSGILDFLPENSLLISMNDRRYLWEANWDNIGLYEEFYGNWSRHVPASVGDERLLRAIADAALESGAVPDDEGYLSVQPEDVYLIFYSGSRDHGFSRLGRLRRAELNVNDLSLREAETDRVLYFVSGLYPEQSSVMYTNADGGFRQVPLEEQLRVRRTENGILYQLPEEERLLFDSLTSLW